MERNIVDGSYSKDSMEIMDRLTEERISQEEVIKRTSELKDDNNEEINKMLEEGENENDKYKRR